jgi:hypothetical protein
MTARSFRRVLPLVAALVCCLTVGAADEKRRAFGPEWKKVDPQSDLGKFGYEYERAVNVTIRHTYGNVAGFELPLECGDRAAGHELDDNAGATVEIRSRESETYGGFAVSKDPKGKPESYTLSAGPNRYFDLDADGMIDAMYDNRDKRGVPMILFEGRFVPVEDQRSLFRRAPGETLKVWGVGRNEAYEFTKGRWNLTK